MIFTFVQFGLDFQSYTILYPRFQLSQLLMDPLDLFMKHLSFISSISTILMFSEEYIEMKVQELLICRKKFKSCTSIDKCQLV